ncbi:hypothetical protein GGH13_005781 [Coemansia sp. S155-1]|nr:hypothetical protein GGH13_005781 [Coemansia sp. S155-1]
MYDCNPEPMGTLAERRMRQMSSDIRSKPDWMETISNADARAGWAAKAKARWLTDVEFAYVLDELAYNIKLSAADGVWFSDTLVDDKTTNELRDYVAILESVPDRQKDWYPNDRSRVLNLLDPSLYPLIYSCSKLCHETSMSPQAALKLGKVGEFPGSIEGWHKTLNVTEGGEPDYHLPTGHGRWLPSEFRIGDNGAVTIESYINNLHPVKHAALYPIIASVFSKFLPLLEQVVTDLVHPRQPRVKPNRDKYKSNEPLPDRNNDYYEEDLILWKRRATFVHPQPEPFVAPARPVSPYNLRGRRLQAIVKIVAGLANERIIATGVFFYDVANIAPASLGVREAICSWNFEAEQCDIESVVKAYGIEPSQGGEEDPISQELGSVGIKDGRCVVFPNINQYKFPELKLADKTKPGHCKMLTFYFVDPSTRIPSTEIVPPQQLDWYFEDILEFEPFRGLPQLVMDSILAKVDFPI